MPQGHDDIAWTWTAPSGQKFTGTPDFIAGARAGWEARTWTPRACKFASACEFSHHPDDNADHTHGGTW